MFYVPSLSATTIVFKGMVMPQYLTEFFPDLQDPRLESSVAVFHQRFSTNTLPQWRLAHPFRYLAHNGEINTIQGNRNWALARGPVFRSPLLPDLQDILPLVSLTGSDSQSLDNMLEVLLMGGLDAMHAMRLLMPPAWHGLDSIDPDLRAFYEYYSVHMEPWDGPAGIVLTDGRYAACTLDRNGLRPARFVITQNRFLTIASEIGVWDYAPEDVVRKGKLGPGDMIALDLQTGTLLESSDIDSILKSRHPYKAWLKKGVRYLETDLVDPRLAAEPMDRDTLALYQKMFNVTLGGARRDHPRARRGRERSGGLDGRRHADAGAVAQGALAVRLLPAAVRAGDQPADRSAARVDRDVAADADRPGVQHLRAGAGACAADRARLADPVAAQAAADPRRCKDVTHEFIDLQYDPAEGLKAAHRAHVRAGGSRGARRQARAAAVRSLSRARASCRRTRCSSTGAVHHHLVRTGLRCKCNLLIETGTARDPHHFACLHRLWRDGRVSVHGLPGAVRDDAQGPREARLRDAPGARPQLSRGHPQGPVQDHVEDGHLDHRQLPQLAAVRDRRACTTRS